VFYASGHLVEMYSARKNEPTKVFAKFKENVTALCTRSDARMFAVGMDSGVVQVLDVKNRLSLRLFDNHKKRVNALDYSNFNDLYSGGDDMTIRKFDVAAGSVVHSFGKAHSDYIKAIQSLQDNHLATAGYDGKIKFWDFRVQKGTTLEFDHGHPVEAIDRYPSGMAVVSCGGNNVSVWDVRASRQLYTGESNKKLVTCVRVL
jgi:WD40 repeat protein